MPRAIPSVLLPVATAIAAGASGPLAAQEAQWQAAAPFMPPALSDESPHASAECLALAIAYEAGFDPVAGQEAVAQVILNRVRHPAYPDGACAAVWQGSNRRTGCQFTFTCDGSLRRPRTPAAMAAAMAVAVRVLAGQSADHVRGATHYHASYVSPYWAPSLTRVRQIATHVFYRMPGAGLSSDKGAPVMVTLAARSTEAATASPNPANPAIRNGEYAPWGLSVGPVRR